MEEISLAQSWAEFLVLNSSLCCLHFVVFVLFCGQYFIWSRFFFIFCLVFCGPSTTTCIYSCWGWTGGISSWRFYIRNGHAYGPWSGELLRTCASQGGKAGPRFEKAFHKVVSGGSCPIWMFFHLFPYCGSRSYVDTIEEKKGRLQVLARQLHLLTCWEWKTLVLAAAVRRRRRGGLPAAG